MLSLCSKGLVLVLFAEAFATSFHSSSEVGARSTNSTYNPEMQALCDLIDIGAKSVWYDWNCDHSIPPAVYCEWDGLSCESFSITGLVLDYGSLVGTLPSSIGNLESLTDLQVSYNYLTGTLPEILCSLQYLEYLRADFNFLSGSIPSCFGQYNDNFDLNLGSNLFTELPSSFKGSTLNLRHNRISQTLPCGLDVDELDIDYNSLYGTLPDCFKSNLNKLSLSYNSLSGSIPPSLATGYKARIDLSHNALNGTIPVEFDDISLIHLDLSSNLLTGTISMHLGSSLVMDYLYLSFNKLTGNLPMSGQFINWVVDVYHNNLNGVIFANWSENASVRRLSVSHNELHGSIPDWVCDSQIESLFVSDNNLDPDSCYPSCLALLQQDFYSSIPRCYSATDIAMCDLVKTVRTSDKMNATTIQSTVSRASPISGGYFLYAEEFNFANAYSYTVSFTSTTKLATEDYLGIEFYNHYSGNYEYYDYFYGSQDLPGLGSPPLVLNSSNVLITASFRDTSIGGFALSITYTIRVNGWRCVTEQRKNLTLQFAYPCLWNGVSCYRDQVTQLTLSNLNMRGTLPESLGLLPSLVSLDLSSNSLTGTIPTSLFDMPALTMLDLSLNSLTGTLPDVISTERSVLEVLNLEHNSFNGSIPMFLTLIDSLVSINLDVNHFSGKMTDDMCDILASGSSISVVDTDLDCYESCWEEYTDRPQLFTHDSGLAYCAPTSYPTSTPTAPTAIPTVVSPAQPTISLSLIIGISVGLVLLSCVALVILYRFMRSKIHPSEENIELTNMLSASPIHKAIFERKTLTPEFVSENILTANKLTPDGKTALDLILDAGAKCDANAVVVFMLLDNLLPRDLENFKTAKEDCMNCNTAWCRMVQQHDARSLTVVEKVLTTYRASVTLLANGRDELERKFVSIASAQCKNAINNVLYLNGRFELFAGPPEYKTSSSLIRFAYDHRVVRSTITAASVGAVTVKKVALKFCSISSSFRQEVQNRLVTTGNCEKYIISVLGTFDGDSDNDEQKSFRMDAITKGYEDYPYCVVMEAADLNLNRYINSQRIAGKDWDEVKRIFKQLVSCIEFLHRNRVIHGDVNPNNVVVLSNGTLKLIDFDSSVQFATSSYASKDCTGYCPPEYFSHQFDEEDGSIRIVGRSYRHNTFESNPAQDIWGLGVILYQLSTGVPLFLCDMEGNIADADDLIALSEWEDSTRDRKLSKISDKLARNLVSLMLTKNVEKRIDAQHVLEHPFLSGKQAIRLSGEQSEFDLFISYRVSSDAHHATMLHRELTARGLKVWLDSQCLKSGKNWEVGFCEGLFKSNYFVCLTSKNGMKNDSVDSYNWEKLSEASACDNVLLEWMLALELQHRSLIKGVFPVFVGSTTINECTYDKFYLGGRDVANVSVATVEEKLKIHLDREACGLPYNLKYSVRSVVNEVVSNQGAFVSGELDEAMKLVVDKIVEMVRA